MLKIRGLLTNGEAPLLTSSKAWTSNFQDLSWKYLSTSTKIRDSHCKTWIRALKDQLRRTKECCVNVEDRCKCYRSMTLGNKHIWSVKFVYHLLIYNGLISDHETVLWFFTPHILLDGFSMLYPVLTICEWIIYFYMRLLCFLIN